MLRQDDSIDSVCAVETMACYHFLGTIELGDGTILPVKGASQDMPLPGYVNRWRYVITGQPAGQLSAALAPFLVATEASVGVTAIRLSDGSGGAIAEALHPEVDTLRYWRLEMRPTNHVIAHKFAEVAGSSEYRAQVFQALIPGNGGEVSVLITEVRL